MNKSTILKIMGTVAVINIAARLLGFLRELVIGYQYGTSELADLIITVYTVPNFIYIVVGGAVTTAFISIYIRTEENRQAFLEDSLRFVIYLGAAVMLLTLGGMWVFKEALFGEYMPEHTALINGLLLWMVPSAFFLIISTWVNGVLNSRKQFTISVLSSLIYNAIFLALAVALTAVAGALSYGIGSLVAAVVMLVYLNRHVPLLPVFRPFSRFAAPEEIKRLVLLALPILLGGATIQFYFIIHRYFSLQLPEGYVAAVNYASKLTQFPQALLMTVVTTVLYPLITEGVKDRDDRMVHALFFRGLRVLGLLLVPAAMLLWLYAEPIIEVVYEYGNFTAEDTELTAPLLRVFGLSLFFISANMFITRFFYANENSVLPVVISLLSVFGINVLLIVTLIDEYGAAAIAWGTVGSSAVQFVLLFWGGVKILGITGTVRWIWKDALFFALLFALLAFVKEMTTGYLPFISLIVGLTALLAGFFLFSKLLQIPLNKLFTK